MTCPATASCRFARFFLALLLLFFVGAVAAQVVKPTPEPHSIFRVPFHTVHGMILMDAVVDGKPASLLLDTGANNTIVSPQAVGVATVQLRALQATQAGTGAEGDYVIREADVRLAERRWINRRVLVMDLTDASKRMGTRVDGFLGQDVLREFSAVRIDFKNGVVELEAQATKDRTSKEGTQ